MRNWVNAIARALQALRLESTRRKVLVFAGVAALAPTLAATVVSYRENRRLLANATAETLRSASSETARALEEWLDERRSDLRDAASSYVVSENLARIAANRGGTALARMRDYLNSTRERLPDCEALLVTDTHGHGVASSGGRLTGLFLSQDKLASLRTGDGLVGDAFWDAGLGRAVISFAVPVRQPDGAFVGALLAKLNLRSVTDLLERLAPGTGGGLYVTTEQGRLVVASRGNSADLMRTKLPALTAEALFDKEGNLVTYKRADGRPVVGALRRIPPLHWAAVAELPEAEAQRPVGELRTVTAWLLGVLLVGLGSIFYVMGVLVVRPLEQLTSAAGRLAAGDLSVELPADGTGDVGVLTRAFRQLTTRLREREGQGELERLSVTDALTGLYNRRHLMGTLANEVQRSRRLRRTFSVLLADVDHFKRYNDTHGHLAGDAALVKIAEILRKTTRGVDSVARYGGEEFLVMLLETTLATAVVVAERIRARVESEAFGPGTVTISIGLAEYPTHGDTPEELIASADAAMYQAKGEGRNRVVAAGDKRQPEPASKRRRRAQD